MAKTVLMVCKKDHEHIVGELQVEQLQATPCPWCRSPIRAVRGWKFKPNQRLPKAAAT